MSRTITPSALAPHFAREIDKAFRAEFGIAVTTIWNPTVGSFGAYVCHRDDGVNMTTEQRAYVSGWETAWSRAGDLMGL